MTRTFYTAFEETAAKFPNGRAVSFMESDGRIKSYTYSQYLLAIKALSKTLVAMGIKKENRVVINSENTIFFHAALATLSRIGCVPVLIDPSLPIKELVRLYGIAKPSAAIVSWKVAEKLKDSTISLEMPVLDIDNNFYPFPWSINRIKRQSSHKDDALLGNDTMAIFFSSGTTASAKAVVTNFKGVGKQIYDIIKDFNLNTKDRHLHILPIYHIYGFIASAISLFSGGELHMIEAVSSIPKALKLVSPTILFGIPKLLDNFQRQILKTVNESSPIKRAMFKKLYELNKNTIQRGGKNMGKIYFKEIHKAFGGKLRLLGSGGSKLDSETAEFLLACGFDVTIGYGLTEAGIPVAVNRPRDFAMGAIGKVFRTSKVIIDNPDSSGQGEILVKSDGVMAGYLGDPETTKQVKRRDGYIRTGDLGYLEGGDILCMTGRAKEAIVLESGKKASPNDIEEFYKDIENVKEMAVFGLPQDNGRFDKIVGVFVFVNMDLAEETWEKIKKITASLPQHLKMSITKLISELPKTNIGKPKRALLKKMMEDKEL